MLHTPVIARDVKTGRFTRVVLTPGAYQSVRPLGPRFILRPTVTRFPALPAFNGLFLAFSIGFIAVAVLA